MSDLIKREEELEGEIFHNEMIIQVSGNSELIEKASSRLKKAWEELDEIRSWKQSKLWKTMYETD